MAVRPCTLQLGLLIQYQLEGGELVLGFISPALSFRGKSGKGVCDGFTC